MSNKKIKRFCVELKNGTTLEMTIKLFVAQQRKRFPIVPRQHFEFILIQVLTGASGSGQLYARLKKEFEQVKILWVK